MTKFMFLALLSLQGCSLLVQDAPCAKRYPSKIATIGQCDAIDYCAVTLEDGTQMAYADKPVVGEHIRGYTCQEY